MSDTDEPAAVSRPVNSNADGLVIVPLSILANLTLVAARVAHNTRLHYDLRSDDAYAVNMARSALRQVKADPILAKLLDDDLAGERYR